MWTRLLLALLLAGIYAHGKEDGIEQNLDLGDAEENRQRSKVVGKSHMPILQLNSLICL